MGYGNKNKPIVQVDNAEIKNQLNDELYFAMENQENFVDIINKANAKNQKLYVKKTADRTFEVGVPFKGSKTSHYYMEKDSNDDFVKLSGGYVSEYGANSTLGSNVNYDTKTGTWTTGSTNEYTTEVGATFTTTFTGNGLDFRHFEDDRGGVWEFVVDDNWSLLYSTYGISNSTKVSRIFEGLPDGSHTIVGTFQGDDPDNPPSSGAGTARGWVQNGAAPNTTYQILITDGYTLNDEVEVFKMASNKEFAISITPTGATSTHWIPEHNATGTAFAISQEVYFDNELQTDWTAENSFSQYDSVQVIQRMYGKHPDHANNSMEFITIHTFNIDGVFTKTKIKVLEDTLFNDGYVMMLPCNNAFTDRILTSRDNKYGVGSTAQDIDFTENDKALSLMLLNNTDFPNYVGAMTISQPKKTLRVGGAGRRSNLMWLQIRDASIAKVYPQVFEDYQAVAGDEFEFSGYYTIGELPLADELY